MKKVQFIALLMCVVGILALFAGCEKVTKTTGSIATTAEIGEQISASAVPIFGVEDFSTFTVGETTFSEVQSYLKANVESYTNYDKPLGLWSGGVGDFMYFPLNNGNYMMVVFLGEDLGSSIIIDIKEVSADEAPAVTR